MCLYVIGPVRDLTQLDPLGEQEDDLTDSASEWITIENDQTYQAVMSLVDSSISKAIELIRDEKATPSTNNRNQSATVSEDKEAILVLDKQQSDFNVVQDASPQEDSDPAMSEKKSLHLLKLY